MQRIPIAITAISLLFAATASPPASAADSFDIVVYGGTSSGIIAAIQAKRMGKSVVLIEPSQHLGGLTTGGLGATDMGNKDAIGGLAREFYHRIWRHYQNQNAWTRETREAYNATHKNCLAADTMWSFEPHVASQMYRDWLAEVGVKPIMNERLDRKRGVKETAVVAGLPTVPPSAGSGDPRTTRIESITMESGRTIVGKMFIDATYEGDLMAATGVSYTVGREANSKYNESINGVQAKLNVKNHRYKQPVDPYVKSGEPASGLLWGIQTTELAANGSGDKLVQAYCFRLCTTEVPDNRRPWPKPADYDESRYELLLRNFEAGDDRAPWHPLFMPNRKTDTNNNGAYSTDFIGGNHDYPEADHQTREKIVAAHRSYQEGLLWTLANNPRVPAKVREEFQRLGMAKDEFVENDNWPTQLYIREARRMIGPYVMTEHNCRGTQVADDSIGLGAYGMDSHNCQRYVTPDSHVQNEGDVQVAGFKPYPISYRSITPKAGECENLLVPVCLSCSHIAYGSIRMEPVFMILGQSAATAAALAIDDGATVQQVDYESLSQRLRDDRQVLARSKQK